MYDREASGDERSRVSEFTLVVSPLGDFTLGPSASNSTKLAERSKTFAHEFQINGRQKVLFEPPVPMKRRGARLVISGAREGLKAAIHRVLNATWGRTAGSILCATCSPMWKNGRRLTAAIIRMIFAKDNTAAAKT